MRTLLVVAPALLMGGAEGQTIPTNCATYREFITFSDLVTTACCTGFNTCAPGSGDIPTTCSQQCATVLKPMQTYCANLLSQIGMTQAVNQAASTCPNTGSFPPPPPPPNPFGPPPPAPPSPFGPPPPAPPNPFGPPPPPAGGACTAPVPTVVGGAYTLQYGGTTATLMCQYGYTMSTYGASITCTNNFWSQAGTCTSSGGLNPPPPPPPNPFGPPPPPPAGGATCGALPVIDPATGAWTQRSATTASLTCMYSYNPSSAATRVSCVNGVWTAPNDSYGSPQRPANCGQHHRRRQLRGSD
jgi:hypothetical protein